MVKNLWGIALFGTLVALFSNLVCVHGGASPAACTDTDASNWTPNVWVAAQFGKRIVSWGVSTGGVPKFVKKVLNAEMTMVGQPCRDCFIAAMTCGAACKDYCAADPYLPVCMQCNEEKGCIGGFNTCAGIASLPMRPPEVLTILQLGEEAALAKYGSGPFTGTLVDAVALPTGPLVMANDAGLRYEPISSGVYVAIALGIALPAISAYYWVFHRKNGRLHYTTKLA